MAVISTEPSDNCHLDLWERSFLIRNRFLSSFEMTFIALKGRFMPAQGGQPWVDQRSNNTVLNPFPFGPLLRSNIDMVAVQKPEPLLRRGWLLDSVFSFCILMAMP